MTRAEHLAWAKKRALEYLDSENINDAFMSMCSDLSKHEELAGHSGIQLGLMLKLGGRMSSVRDVKYWIEDFR